MTRLDEHIAYVRQRILFSRFLRDLCWAAIIWAGVFILAVLASRLFWKILPLPYAWLAGSIVAAVAGAWVISRRRKPSAQHIAAIIDQRLGLRERFSTALSMDQVNDPFASAVRADAASTAEIVSPRGRFPIQRPKKTNLAVLSVIAAIVFWLLFPQMDLLHRRAGQQVMAAQQQQQQQAKQILHDAAAKIDSQTKAMAGDAQIQQIKQQMRKELSAPPADPAQAKRDAAKAMQQLAQAMQQRSDQSVAAADAQKDVLHQLDPPKGNSTIDKAHRELASGNFDKASQQIKQAAEQAKNDTMAQKRASARQMEQLAQQLQQAAQNNQVRQSTQQQLQQMGFTPKQIQQMTSPAPPASKLDEMISKYLPHLSPFEHQRAARLSQKASADQQARNQAMSLSKSAEKMSQAMQQPQPNSQLSSAAQSMQRQLQQMQAQQQSAQQQQRQAMNAHSAAQSAMQGLNKGSQPNSASAGNEHASSQGPPSSLNSPTGQSNNPRAGHGHAGLNMQSPTAGPAFTIKPEAPLPQGNPNGQVLADFLVKGETVKGKSLQQLQDVAIAQQRMSAEDTGSESIDPGTRQIVKKYFQSLSEK